MNDFTAFKSSNFISGYLLYLKLTNRSKEAICLTASLWFRTKTAIMQFKPIREKVTLLMVGFNWYIGEK